MADGAPCSTFFMQQYIMDTRTTASFYPEINLTWYSSGQWLVLFVKTMMWEFAVVISLQNGKEQLLNTCTKGMQEDVHFFTRGQQAQNPGHQRAFP